MQETKLGTESMNIIENNIEQLKQLFPEIVTEGKIDFYKLREVLGDEIDDSDEKYEFTWSGKHDAIRESQIKNTKVLRPYIEESKNWETTKNLYIEGDNLEVLKILQKSYQSRIKMMYIDPPYNTGNDQFVYDDNFRESENEHIKNEENEGKLQSNPNTSSRYHTNWLNMMYPRLRLARNLLSENGVIFISIDDNEVENLKEICNEIFGKQNSLGTIIIKSNPGGRDYGGIALTHEYVLCYSKNLKTELNMVYDYDKQFKYEDEIGGFDLREIRNRNIRFNIDNRPNLCYPFYVNPNNIDENNLYEISLEPKDNYIEVMPLKSQGIQTVWRWGKEKSLKNLNINLKAKKKNDGTFMIVEKYRNNFKRERTIWDETSVRNEAGSLLIKELFENKKPFDYPKSLDTIKRLISLGNTEECIIMDFFSGSATTAHAVMDLNINNNLKNNFIMVQIPEETEEKSAAYKEGYKNICEIGKERIRRAGDKLLKEHPESQTDVGFKVFKVDSSNFKEWEPNDSPLEEYLEDSIINIKDDRSDLDLVYDVILKYGIDLTALVEEVKKEKYNFYSIGFGALIACLDDEVNEDVTDEILDIINENTELLDKNNKHVNRVVFKDNSFLDDSVKTNIIQVLKNNDIEDIITY